MRALRTAAAIAPWAVALAWVWKALETRAGARRLTDISCGRAPKLAHPADGTPLVSAIVAACNEEQAIAATVRSLLGNRGLPIEVIAVDDRSTDRTGTILDGLAGEPDTAGRLRVLHIADLPEGWLGKPHALATGAAEARAPWLLFTDGDIFFREDTLARALDYAQTHAVDHLILAATPIARSRGEQIVLAAIPVLASWALRIWKVNEPGTRESLGTGAFTLVRREAYDTVGGWPAVRYEVLEDLRFGWELKRRHGLRQHVVVGRGLIRLHWAAGALGLARNLGKNGFAVFRYSMLRMAAGTLGMLLLVFAPLAGWLAPRLAGRYARWAVLPYALALGQLARSHARQFTQPAYSLAFLPVGTLLLLYGVVRSAVLTLARGGVEWRGTRYPLARLRASSGPL